MTRKATQVRVSQKAQSEKLLDAMKQWQDVEDASVQMSNELMQKAQNPLLKMIAEILRNDSVMHKKVQQFIIDSMTKQAVTLTPEELAEIWDIIEKHDQAERAAIALGEECLQNTKNFVHSTLLSYLTEDEKKHDRILFQLEGFKRKIYPYM